eukprot:TRINITY_DN3633_c0_g1_i3.p1 TRINITY_DN3633_c0_g1~~TRINITY_DN3633_c0_g1_i3.p1  ORF type:complete len:387 (-),score=90.67 TRINITY_DN3633_c0_g1_i3:31-1119(-)
MAEGSLLAQPPSPPVEGEADPAVLAYAQWLAESFALHAQRQEGLSREISALREASMSGAAAIVDLRNSVEEQFRRLDQDLAEARLALADVVIDKENNEGELRCDVDAIRSDGETLKGHFHEVQESLRSVLQQQVLDARQMCQKTCETAKYECDGLRQDVDGMQKTMHEFSERLNHETRENSSLFTKMFKVLHEESNGVVPAIDELKRAREKIEPQLQELRRDFDESRDNARKYLENHEKLEPRVFHLEETQRAATSERASLMKRVKEFPSGKQALNWGSDAVSTCTGATPVAGDGPATAGVADGRFDAYGYPPGSTPKGVQAQQLQLGGSPQEAARRGQQAFRGAAHSPPPPVSRAPPSRPA